MKYRWFIILLWFIALPLQAQNGNIVIPESVRVRSGPSESEIYISIGAVFAGDRVQPLYRSADNTWVLIVYERQTGWIPRSTVNWADDIEALPVLAAGVTPSPPVTPTPAILIPTESPGQGFVLPGDAARAFVRSGPGRGYESLGQLLSGTLVEPFARNEDVSWILIRYKNVETTFDGFGWVARNLVQWRSSDYLLTLPVMMPDNLTPSATFTPSISPTASNTAVISETPLPSHTPTHTPTLTATDSPTATFTWTALPTTIVPSETFTDVPPPTATLALPSETPLEAGIPPTATHTALPTFTPVPVIESTPTPTEIQITPSAEPTTAVPASETPIIIPTPVPQAAPENSTNGDAVMPLLIPAVIGAGIAILAAFIYIGMFAQNMSHVRLYQDGFVVDICPVCQRGHLTIEAKQTHSFGIPRVRRTVRCSSCRSVLREKGTRRWLYAVDRIENPQLYERFNGQEVTDEELAQLR